MCTAGQPLALRSRYSTDAAQLSVPIPCPYTLGANLKLEYTQEGSCGTPVPLEVHVIKTFEPFTVAQCMVVEPISTRHDLPSRLVLKLVDHRFSTNGLEYVPPRSSWTTAVDAAFKRGFNKVRTGATENIWTTLGGPGVRYGTIAPGDPEWEDDWMPEMNRWDAFATGFRREVAAYRHLRSLQGRDIPRMYGTCRYRTPDATDDTDPLLANINGVLVEYIDGPSMEKLEVRKDLSDEDAERASQGLLSIIRKLRALRAIHNDIAPRNVIIRRDDIDHPVLIDFGSARVIPPHQSPEEWDELSVDCQELRDARLFLAENGWHNPSPWRKFHEDPPPFFRGFGHSNYEVEKMRPDWRDQKFEFIPGLQDVKKVDKNGKEYIWEPMRWRIKPGVKTCDDDM
ncbi:hypothetical protein PLICRDRAFT_122334 [Plicaturopsis crispa FD-325 SS-3]|nr:hypothetical protein PLICRDRAFT_122334 [Plicaturopsis crispa FD-325 SS-3]